MKAKPAAPSAYLHALLPTWVLLLAFVFAQVEIQIEGSNGWAAGLPTWRIESGGFLQEWLWGGRPLTGYHVWIFAFMALVFHLPVFVGGRFSPRLEMRILGCLMLFWIVEDFIWFVMNPAFGLSRFNPSMVPWHKHWVFGMPLDYPLFLGTGIVLLWLSYRRKAGESEAS